jgi:hypothetical protein
VAVAPDVTRAHVEDELNEARGWAERHRWSINWRSEQLILEVTMRSVIDEEIYELEATLRDYRALPAAFELRHLVTGERGTHRCYPKGGLGYFHNQPVLCAPWNRKAYAALGGPHSDWAMAQWWTYRPNHARLGDILALIQELLNDRSSYQGRMAR